MFLTIKTGSVLTQFIPKKKLNNTVQQHKGLLLSKSRLADFQDIEETKNTKKGPFPTKSVPEMTL